MKTILKTFFLLITLISSNYALTISKTSPASFDKDFHFHIIENLLNSWLFERYGLFINDDHFSQFEIKINQNKELLILYLSNKKTSWNQTFNISLNVDYVSCHIYIELLDELQEQIKVKDLPINPQLSSVRLYYPFSNKASNLNLDPPVYKAGETIPHLDHLSKLLSQIFIYSNSNFYSTETLKAKACAEYILYQWNPTDTTDEASNKYSSIDVLLDIFQIILGDVRGVDIMSNGKIATNRLDLNWKTLITLLLTKDFTTIEDWKKKIKEK